MNRHAHGVRRASGGRRTRSRPAALRAAALAALALGLMHPLPAASALGEDPVTVRLEVRAPARKNLDTMVPVMEGRLLERLRDERRFRFVPGDEPSEARLLLEIHDLTFAQQGGYEMPYEADSDPRNPRYTYSIGGELELDLTLGRAAGEQILYEDTLRVAASRRMDLPAEQMRGLVVDDLMDRVAEKVARILRKRLKR